MAYCTSDDLISYRPSICGLGIPDWTTVIAEGDSIIDRAIERQWYRSQCREYGLDYRNTPFNAALLLTVIQVKRTSIFKALELAYLYLMKDTEKPDAFERQMELFKVLYKDELKETLATGLDYDWDESGDLAYTEKLAPKIRRLHRC